MSKDNSALPEKPPPPPPAAPTPDEPVEEIDPDESDPHGEERRRQRPSNPGRVLPDKSTGLGVEIIDRGGASFLDWREPMSRRSHGPAFASAIRSGPAVATRGR